MTEIKDVLCNLCGLSCVLSAGKPFQELGGLIDASVTGGYMSTPGNGEGALDDTERYRFSLCEFCLDWLFEQFKIQVVIDWYMDDFCPREGETQEETSARTGGFFKPLRTQGQPPAWQPAAERVAKDDWRTTKAKFTEEAARRAAARTARKL